MSHPKLLSIKDFSYDLPEQSIAFYPLPERDASKLLVYKSGIHTDVYKNIAAHIPENALMIFNNTKVVEARLIMHKPTGGQLELFCLEPDAQYGDITNAMLQKGNVLWKCMVGGAKKWKSGSLEKAIDYQHSQIVLKAQKVQQHTDCFTIAFSWDNPHICFAEILHAAGLIPLPPYINRNADEADKERYQTIYAKQDGSVAAPTAGLHFTEQVFNSFAAKNIQPEYVTLHVGAGTFKPVKSETMQDHEMHSEFIDVSLSAIEKLIDQLPNTIISVGTTSLRTIETLYWMGVKIAGFDGAYDAISIDQINIQQWDAYELPQHIDAKEALGYLRLWMLANHQNRLLTNTQIIIAPPYKLKVAHALVTNFHQPQSTLLLLVASVVGEVWKEIYQYALNNNFRFLSYGDGSLLWRRP